MTSGALATRVLAPVVPLALALALAAAGCGGDSSAGPATRPVPGCEKLDATPCDVRAASCQTRLFALATCLRSDVQGPLPPVTVVTEADYAALEAAASAASPPQPHVATWDWALSALRLIQPGALTPAAQTAEMVKKVLGQYRNNTKDILVIDHGDNFNATTASIVLVHEFVHALQFREMELTPLLGLYADASGDTRLAIRGMIEGEARMQETRYSASALGLDPTAIDWTRRFENAVTRDEAAVLKSPSPLTTSDFAFPYEWGARYIYFSWMATGMAGVHALFSTPPTTTRVLMASTDRTLAPEATPAPPPLPVPPVSWTMADADTLGAWGLFLALEKSGTLATATELHSLALQWQTDRVAIYEQSAPPATAVVWRIGMPDEPTAARVLQLLTVALPTINLQQQGASVLAASATDGQPVDWAFGPAP